MPSAALRLLSPSQCAVAGPVFPATKMARKQALRH
jgi:hypothetical protein